MSSARAVRCRLKCHNERNPPPRLPAGHAGHSADTAAARREEGGDDVKSARPLRPGRHTCYNGGHRGMPPREGARIPKPRPSSDWSLQPGSTKLDSLVIAHQPWRGEYVPGPCSRNKVAVPEGAAGTPPFWVPRWTGKWRASCAVVLCYGNLRRKPGPCGTGVRETRRLA